MNTVSSSSRPILVAGLINIETTVQVDSFPIAYTPVRFPFFGVRSTVSGVGYNVAKALTRLGRPVRLLSLIGRDAAGDLVRDSLAKDRISDEFVLDQLAETPQSAILYDREGRRQINVDLKDIQEQTYPLAVWEQAVAGQLTSDGRPDIVVLCNVNFARPLLALAQQRKLMIATDVHAIAELADAYNADFMRAADILFMSDEHLPLPPEAWAQQVMSRYATEIVVIGLGAAGSLLAVRSDDAFLHVPAVTTRPVVNTIGAGDALFSSFLHVYEKTRDPYAAIRTATVFASYKIGARGAAEGFLDEQGLEEWRRAVFPATG